MEEKSLKQIIREEWSKLSVLSWKERFGYIWDYYKPLMAAIVGIIAVVNIGFTIYHNKQIDYLFSVYMVNCNTYSVDADQIEEDIASLLGGLEKNQEVTVDTSVIITGEASESAIVYQMKLMALIAGGEIDIMLATEDVFESYANQDAFLDLSEVLTEQELEQWEDLLVYYVVPSDETEDVSENAADGSGTESVLETASGGSEIENVSDAASDGSETESVSEGAFDGSETESVSEAAPDGSGTGDASEAVSVDAVSESGEDDTDTGGSSVKEGVALALDVTDSPMANYYDAYYGGTVYAAVLVNSEHVDLCGMFLEYIMNEEVWREKNE